MQIRDAQMKTLEEAVHRGFLARVGEIVRETLPQYSSRLTGDELIEAIRRLESRAAQMGVLSEQGIARWVCLGMVAGEKFDEIPEVRAFFNVPGDRETQMESLFRSVVQIAERSSQAG